MTWRDAAARGLSTSTSGGLLLAAAIGLVIAPAPAVGQAQRKAGAGPRLGRQTGRAEDPGLLPPRGQAGRRGERPLDLHLRGGSGGRLPPASEGRGRFHGPSGWADAGRVVPIDQAVAFFSDRIEADPKDAFARVMRAIALDGRDMASLATTRLVT